MSYEDEDDEEDEEDDESQEALSTKRTASPNPKMRKKNQSMSANLTDPPGPVTVVAKGDFIISKLYFDNEAMRKAWENLKDLLASGWKVLIRLLWKVEWETHFDNG